MSSGLQRGTGNESFSLSGAQNRKGMCYYMMAWHVSWSIHSGTSEV